MFGSQGNMPAPLAAGLNRRVRRHQRRAFVAGGVAGAGLFAARRRIGRRIGKGLLTGTRRLSRGLRRRGLLSRGANVGFGLGTRLGPERAARLGGFLIRHPRILRGTQAGVGAVSRGGALARGLGRAMRFGSYLSRV